MLLHKGLSKSYTYNRDAINNIISVNGNDGERMMRDVENSSPDEKNRL